MSSCRSTIIQLSPPEPRDLSWSLRVDGSNGIRKDVNHANPGGPYPAPFCDSRELSKRGVLEPTSRPKPLRGPSRPRSLRPRTLRSSLLAGASFCELVQYWAAPRILAFQPAPVGQPTPCPLKLTDSPPFVKK